MLQRIPYLFLFRVLKEPIAGSYIIPYPFPGVPYIFILAFYFCQDLLNPQGEDLKLPLKVSYIASPTLSCNKPYSDFLQLVARHWYLSCQRVFDLGLYILQKSFLGILPLLLGKFRGKYLSFYAQLAPFL